MVAARSATHVLWRPIRWGNGPVRTGSRTRVSGLFGGRRNISSASEDKILSAALDQVPQHGFTQAAIAEGLRSLSYPEVSSNLVSQGPHGLVTYYLRTRRNLLEKSPNLKDEATVDEKLKAVALQRLRFNIPIIHKWQEALALLAQPANVPTSVSELWYLSDAMWNLAGDAATDESWYSKRAALMGIYSSAELYMTTDSSADFIETERYLRRSFDRSKGIADSVSAIGEWGAFSAKSFLNVARSKGLWI